MDPIPHVYPWNRTHLQKRQQVPACCLLSGRSEEGFWADLPMTRGDSCLLPVIDCASRMVATAVTDETMTPAATDFDFVEVPEEGPTAAAHRIQYVPAQ